MRSKKKLNEELYRINQIMVNSSSDILLEQAEAKIINKVLDDTITPQGLVKIMKELGFETDGVIPNFLSKFDDLIVYASKGGDEWNEIIQKAAQTKKITRYFNDLGEEIDPSEITPGVKVTMETDYYRVFPDGTENLIDEKTYKDIMETNSEYYSIPPFLRLPTSDLKSSAWWGNRWFFKECRRIYEKSTNLLKRSSINRRT